MTIQVAQNHNNAGALADLTHAPHTFSGILYAETVATPQGILRNGPYCILSYNVLEDDEFAAQNTQFGLASAEFADITLRIPGDAITSETNYNGQVIRPRDAQPDGTCYYGIRYMVRFLEAI